MKKAMTKTVKVKTRVAVKLTEKEIQDRSTLTVEVVENLKQLEIDFKEIKAEWSAKLKKEKGLLSQLATAASTGREMQTVVAVQTFDFKTNRTFVSYRGETYEERPLSQTEIDQASQMLFEEAPAQENEVGEEVPEGPVEGDENNILKIISEERSVKTKVDHVAK